MSTNDDFQLKFNNSVIQLIVFIADYDVRRPFSEPIPNYAKGSGFIIDSKRGIVLTNSHVVENIISVKGISPKSNKDIRMRLISICKEKDLAIVQIFKEDMDILLGSNILEMEFEDSLHLESMTPVVAIGYPLGQDNLKFTPGYVSGFETISTSNDDDKSTFKNDESVSYIQTTAPTNPGNSGGPLVNIKTGKVVGVVSAGIESAQNVGYAVSTRTIWSCLDKLMAPILNMTEPPLFSKIQSSLIPAGGYTANLPLINLNKNKISSPKSKILAPSQNEINLPKVIRLPQIGFTYCRITDDLASMYKKTPSTNVKGIYVTKIQKDSVFSLMPLWQIRLMLEREYP